MAPVVSLSASPTMGSCDDMVLDPTGSMGHAGRSWKSILYIIKSDNVGADILTKMMNYMEAYNSSTSDVISIPQKMLVPGIYQITLQLSNFLLASSSTSIRVTVTIFKALPTVNIAGPSVIGRYRWQPLNLFALAKLPPASCAGNLSEVDYSWGISKDFQVIQIKSTSKDPRYFSIPGYMLSLIHI